MRIGSYKPELNKWFFIFDLRAESWDRMGFHPSVHFAVMKFISLPTPGEMITPKMYKGINWFMRFRILPPNTIMRRITIRRPDWFKKMFRYEYYPFYIPEWIFKKFAYIVLKFKEVTTWKIYFVEYGWTRVKFTTWLRAQIFCRKASHKWISFGDPCYCNSDNCFRCQGCGYETHD